MKTNRKIPITRLNKFFSQADFDLEVDFGREWLGGDINMRVILFQVLRGESLTDDIYGEAGRDEIRFKAPVELVVNFKLCGMKDFIIKSYKLIQGSYCRGR